MDGSTDEQYPGRGVVLDLVPTSRSDTYLSWTYDAGEEELVVAAPTDASSRPVTIPLEEQIDVVWKGSAGLRCLAAVLTAVEESEQPRWRLRPVGVVKRGQRRDAVRAPLTVPVHLGEEPHRVRATSVDLSEGGVRCVLEAQRAGDVRNRSWLDVGGVVRLAAVLPDLTISCLAEITRRHPREDARVELSLRFIGLPEHQKDLVRQRVFTRLRSLRQRGLI